jgi:hypothetical protein
MMGKYFLFLKWWLIFTLIVVGTIFAHHSGFFEYIYAKDKSHLSFVILALFYFMSCWCGVKTWNLSRQSYAGTLTPDQRNHFERMEEIGWFSSELCLTVGMIGTVIGFMMMLGNFATIDLSNMTTVQGFITELGLGMSTALSTTLVGLIGSVLLKIQYFNISQANVQLKERA